MKRLWICLLAFALLTGCGDSGDIAVTTVYETDDPTRTALTMSFPASTACVPITV